MTNSSQLFYLPLSLATSLRACLSVRSTVCPLSRPLRGQVGLGKDAKKDAKQHPKLGVVRLDYNYPPGAGDIDSPASFGYDVFYRVVPGLTFEMAQARRPRAVPKSWETRRNLFSIEPLCEAAQTAAPRALTQPLTAAPA